MGGYGYQLNVKERWQVIHYIKSLAGITGEATGDRLPKRKLLQRVKRKLDLYRLKDIAKN